MGMFKLLADPGTYRPCTQDMLVDVEFRTYWLEHFIRHFELMAALAAQVYGPAAADDIAAARRDLAAEMEVLREQPDRYGELDLQMLGLVRQKCLSNHHIPDPFLVTKQRENNAMLPLYPRVAAEIDAYTDPAHTLRVLVEGAFAGNIFDLGATATAKLYAHESPDFFKVRSSLDGRRPWLVDHLAEFSRRLFNGPAYHKALVFVDNAGSDFILGMMPLIRHLAQGGTQVCIAANESASLNDMTIAETRELLPRLAALDPVLKALLETRRITAVSSGGGTPLIDLRDVSEECNHQAADADLLIFEGMGRALESNFHAKFKVDAVKLCMIKEDIIARRHDGKVFDVIFRYDPAA
jgi:type II pantothenate kinase